MLRIAALSVGRLAGVVCHRAVHQEQENLYLVLWLSSSQVNDVESSRHEARLCGKLWLGSRMEPSRIEPSQCMFCPSRRETQGAPESARGRCRSR